MFKLSSLTLKVLKNFSTINDNFLYVDQGNKITTMSSNKTCLATATLDVEFSKSFAIYRVSRFLSALSLFNDPTITVNDTHLLIVDAEKELVYEQLNELVHKPPKNHIDLPSVDVEFMFTKSQLTDTLKALSVLSLDYIAFKGMNNNVYMSAVDVDNITKNMFSIKIGKTNKEFTVVVPVDNVKLMDSEAYNISISKKGIMEIEIPNVTYWISYCSTHSKFAE